MCIYNMDALRRFVSEILRESSSAHWEGVTRITVRQLFAKWVARFTPDEVAIYGGRAGDFSGEIEGFRYHVETRILPQKAVRDAEVGAKFNPRGGGMGSIELTLYVKLNANFQPIASRQEIHAELRSVIRHELEHARQFLSHNRTDPNDPWHSAGNYGTKSRNAKDWDGEDWKKYLLSPIEIDAHVTQTYYSAKKARVPFTYALEDRLMNYDKLTNQDVSDVRRAWLAFARNKFPKAI